MKPIENRQHHYVPQFILRNFVVEGRESLHAFDKSAGKKFQVAVKNAATENGFYSFETDETKGCAEEFFANIEFKAGPLIGQIVQERKLPKINLEQRAILVSFAIAQMLRSVNHRATSFQMGDVLRKLAGDQGTEEFKLWVGEHDPEREKEMLISHLDRDILKYTPAFVDKDILLFDGEVSDVLLLIGDSPLVRTNTLFRSDYVGTTGVANLGVEIYLPLSPTLALAFMCPSIAESMRRVVLTQGRKSPSIVFEYLFAVEAQRNIRLLPENVKHLNSLQIIYAERFLYSSTDSFEMVEDMVANDSRLRTGQRFTTNIPEPPKRGTPHDF